MSRSLQLASSSTSVCPLMRHTTLFRVPVPLRHGCLMRGVLTNGPSSSIGQSFQARHQEVLQDSEWWGPEAPDAALSPAPALSAVAPATAATRTDVRLISAFTTHLRAYKLDLSALFCSEPLLSADSRAICDLRAGHHGELLSEYLTSNVLRVGEQLPHWFVNGNLRGAIKTWMATRPAAAALCHLAGAGSPDSARAASSAAQCSLATSIALQPALGTEVAGGGGGGLVDGLLAAMPAWSARSSEDISGWEAAPGGGASQEDVSLLHTFGAIVYAARLDVGPFLAQLCGADPFAWATVQVAQGTISEPDAWLLERYAMSRHVVGEPLPLWWATWGAREEVRTWLAGKQAAALVRSLVRARGGYPTAAADGSSSSSAGAAGGGAFGGVTACREAAVAAAMDRLEGCVGSLLAGTSSSAAAAGLVVQRQVAVADSSAATGCFNAAAVADLVALRPDGGTAAVAAAVWLQAGEDAGAAVRQAKERLDWLAFLLGQQQGQQEAVARVLLLVAPQQQCQEGQQPLSLPASLVRYLAAAGVRAVWEAELSLPQPGSGADAAEAEAQRRKQAAYVGSVAAAAAARQ